MDEIEITKEFEELSIAADNILSGQLIDNDNNRFEIIDEVLRKRYLSRLSDFEIVGNNDFEDQESDLIKNVRLYKVTEMVYQKGESATDKFTTVFNTLSTYNASVFMIIDSDGEKTEFYLGVRNNAIDKKVKESTVTMGDTLKNTLVGNFPGIKIQNVYRDAIKDISDRVSRLKNTASVSVVGDNKFSKTDADEHFVQGIEKLALAMAGRKYTGIIIAENQSPLNVANYRQNYEDLYTKLSRYKNVQISKQEGKGESRQKSFSEMDKAEKAATIFKMLIPIIAVAGGAVVGGVLTEGAGVKAGAAIGAAAGGVAEKAVSGTAQLVGGVLGSQVGGGLSSFLNALAPIPTDSQNTSFSKSVSIDNKTVIDLLKLIDENIERFNEFDSYGMWNVAGYFMSDDMSSAEIAASNYRSLMNGEKSGREVSAINSWRYGDYNYDGLTRSIAKFCHPLFCYGLNVLPISAATPISGKELGLHLGLPRAAVPGIPVIEHAQFGKEVYTYNEKSIEDLDPSERITLGCVYDLGKETKKLVEIEDNSLTAHMFITGSTGAGKSNTVYHILDELLQDRRHFLVIEPAKGEYWKYFSGRPDVHMYTTSPKHGSLLRINPFSFPDSIHVLEHIDRLVEVFNVCWPMYAAMPAVLKEAIEKSYSDCGWDLYSSENLYGESLYPTFTDVVRNVNHIIDCSDYDSDNKGAYKGALETRLRSLTNGINGMVFAADEISSKDMFDDNVILDISRVGASDTKSLIMGIVILKLQEYRMDTCSGNENAALSHVTVLEEAHHLLRKSTGHSDDGGTTLQSKSVEMLANSIAEMRTYGEGIIIVDQSPGLLDMSVIRNTNTKIMMRLPDLEDRILVGKSAGMNDDQIIEVAKLPRGVAAVYQNEWVQPILCKIHKFEKTLDTGGLIEYDNELKNLSKNYNIDQCIDVAEAISFGIEKLDNISLERLKNEVMNLNIGAYAKVTFLKMIDNPSDELKMSEAGAVFSSLFPDIYKSVKNTYENTKNVIDWTICTNRAFDKAIPKNVDEQLRRDIIQGIITYHIFVEKNDIAKLQEWSLKGGLALTGGNNL